MSNRCFLYLTSHTPDAPLVAIAEGANALPRAWSVLLADARPAPPVTFQRVFGDAYSPGIVTDARLGAERFRLFTDVVKRHPEAEQQRELGLHLDAVSRLIDKRIAEVEAAGGQAFFTADVDELTWLNEGPSADVVAELCADIRAQQEQLDRLAAAPRTEQAKQLESFLGFPAFRLSPRDWDAWDMLIGFSGFEHDYFRQHRHISFEDHERSEDVVVDGCERELAWVRRGERWALATASTKGLLTSVDLDGPGYFEDGVASVRVAGREGLLRRDGTWLVAPHYDEAWPPRDGLIIVRDSNGFGWLDAEGRACVPTQFKAIEPFDGRASTWVKDESGSHRVGRDGKAIDDVRYDDHAPHNLPGLWRVTVGGKVGIVRDDGSVVRPPIWDMIWATDIPERSRVQSGNLFGLVDEHDREVVPVRYTMLDTPNVFGGSDGCHLVVVEDTAGKRGLWDAVAGRELLPCRYSGIELAYAAGACPSWLVAQDTRGEMSTHRWDGSVLVHETFREIAGARGLADACALATAAWAEGQSVNAVTFRGDGTELRIVDGTLAIKEHHTSRSRWWLGVAAFLAYAILRGVWRWWRGP